jgi:hypothetical protein
LPRQIAGDVELLLRIEVPRERAFDDERTERAPTSWLNASSTLSSAGPSP